MSTLLFTAAGVASAQAPADDPTTSDDGIVGFICLIYACAAIVPMIVMIVLALWVNSDASKLGIENPWLWGLLVFLTGIVGLIIYLAVIRPKGQEDQRRKQQMGGGYGAGMSDLRSKDGHCHHCGKYVGATVGRCTYCGSDLASQ